MMSERARALERIQQYLKMRTEKPINGLDDVIHGVHTGTEWEGTLSLSDLLLAVDPPPSGARQQSVPCHCGGVMFGDGNAHTKECPCFEGASPQAETSAQAMKLRDELATRILCVPFRGADVKPAAPYLLLDDVLRAMERPASVSPVEPEPPPSCQWREIATAPEVAWGVVPVDVLLWGKHLSVRTGRACKHPDGSVYADVANVNGNIAEELATHWQPLPSPPVVLVPAKENTK
jgi:hypothetical protein